jgi:hypothetical protein
MPLSDDYALASVMITADVHETGVEPIGTGFLVAIEGPEPNTAFEYLVTAAHTVRFLDHTFFRLIRQNGDTEDIHVDHWTFHDDDETDIAVSEVFLQQTHNQFRFVPEVVFADGHDLSIKLGEPVYFVGLLANIRSMHDLNVPMVRSGSIGRLNQAGVRVRWPDMTEHIMTAHLIDCRSHSGFSGSPCYVQLDPRAYPNSAGIDTYLLGLITGHLDEVGVDNRIANTGVGLVTPVEAIRHVLMQDVFLNRRRYELERHQKITEVTAGDPSSEGPPTPI